MKMFLPNRMTKVNVVFFSRYLNALTEALGKSGLVHLTNAADQSSHRLLQKLDTGADVRAIEQMQARCAVLLEALGIDPSELEAPQVLELSQGEIMAIFEKVDRLYRASSSKITKLLDERSGVERSSRELAEFPFQSLRLDALRNLTQLHMEAGTLSGEDFLRARQSLGEEALFLRESDETDQVLVVTSRKHRFAVEDVLSKFGFRPLALPEGVGEGTVAEKRAELGGRLAELREALDAARLEIVALGEEYGGTLLAINKQLRGLLTVRQAQGMFGHARQLYCVSGWIPEEALPQLQKLVERCTEGTGVIEASGADEAGAVQEGEAVPVQLSDSSLVRPFRSLVTNFGMPNYHELDPSFFVGLTFVVMFGYMFGDAGQGLVLVAAGLFLNLDKSHSQGTRDTGALVFWCGVLAVVFGLVYNSVFGFEGLLPWELPISPSPLRNDLPALLITSVGIGVVFLCVSLIINIINHFRSRKYFEGIFDKCGIVGLFFYLSCLLTALIVVKTRRVALWQILLMAAPLVVIFLAHPVHNLIHHKRIGGEDGSAFGVLLGGVIEIMETLSGYLSGTVSFVRVGAYAISHAALCLAIYSIMQLFGREAGGQTARVLVAIIGNAIVIVFEGMVAAIQCVRLEYYEMFSRYFQGGGVAYKPFKIGEGDGK